MPPTTSPSTYHSQQAVHIDVRPKRAAYLVHPASEKQLRAAIHHASSRWGGIQELIIPVTAGGRIDPAHIELLEVTEPDVLFAVASLTERGKMRTLEVLGLEPRPIEQELRTDSGTHIRDILSNSDAAAPVVGATQRDTTLDHVRFGAFADFNPIDSWRYGIHSSGAIKGGVDAEFNRQTLIQWTAKHCEFSSTTNTFPIRVLWVLDSPTVEELRWVWNLRALASISRGTVYVAQLSETHDDAFRADVERLLRSTALPTEPNLLINSHSVSKPLLVGLRSRLGIHPHHGNKIQRHFGSQRVEDLSAAINWDPRIFLTGTTTTDNRVSIYPDLVHPTTALRADTPFTPNRSGGRVRLRVSGPDFLDAPQYKKVAELFLRNGTWGKHGIEFETSLNRRYNIELSIPPQQDVLAAVLESQEFDHSLSGPGRLGIAVLERMGTDASSLLADGTAISVIRAMTTPRTNRISEQIAASLPQVSETDIEEAIRSALGPPSVRATFSLGDVATALRLSAPAIAKQMDSLVRNGLVSRGLQVKCKTCTLTSFIEMTAARGNPRCPACESVVSYTSNSEKREPEFQYRLDPLLDRASDQGVLSHLFGLEKLREVHPNLFAVPGMQLKARSGSERQSEVDLVGFAGREVFAGEAKYSATGFSPAQIRRDVKIGKALGATTQVMVCLEQLDEAQVEEFEALCKQVGLKPQVLQPS